MSFRLLNIHSGSLSEHAVNQAPTYIAISHAWSEKLFPAGTDFLAAPGSQAVRSVIAQRYRDVTECWIDTICIDQNDENDKNRQIPLMGQIFGGAEAVAIVVDKSLNMVQDDVDTLTQALEGALQMYEGETWTENGAFWQSGPGRGLIVRAMGGLAQLTMTPWATRIWTLQEYILAKAVLWIGNDLVPVTISDILFPALPCICDTLVIDECIGGIYAKLYSHFSGMANCRMKQLDKTRVMELVGNRQASLECDEVYGVMAASGVEIMSRPNEKKERAWKLWFEEAIRQGHIRWLLMPNAITRATSTESTNSCILPCFSTRHKVSAGSALDTVVPLGPVDLHEGTAIVSGRLIGTCQITARLGPVHEPTPNRIHRDITLVLFTKGRWRLAQQIASAFGAGRYNPRQLILLAQVLVGNFTRAVRAVASHKEDGFTMKTHTVRQYVVWHDFIEFQMGQMPGMNDGVAHLARIRNTGVVVDVVVVLGDHGVPPATKLYVLDLGGRTIDQRKIFMIVACGPELIIPAPKTQQSASNQAAMHKVAVTLPITGDFEDLITALPLEQFRIGGRQCAVCRSQDQSPARCSVEKARLAAYSLRDARQLDLIRKRIDRLRAEQRQDKHSVYGALSRRLSSLRARKLQHSIFKLRQLERSLL